MAYSAITIPDVAKKISNQSFAGRVSGTWIGCTWGANVKIYASSDNGATWTHADDSELGGGTYDTVSCVAKGGANWLRIRAGQLGISSDLQAWSAKATPFGFTGGNWPDDLAWSGTEWMTSGVWDGNSLQIAHATDPTGTWTTVDTGITQTSSASVRNFDGAWWLAANQKVYRSTNKTTWTESTAGGSGYYLFGDDAALFASDWTVAKQWNVGTQAWDTLPTVPSANAVVIGVVAGILTVVDWNGDFHRCVDGAWTTENLGVTYTGDPWLESAILGATGIMWFSATGANVPEAAYLYSDGPAVEDILFPVEVEVFDPAEDILFPVVVQVVEPEDILFPVRVEVIDPAATGGLDGAGGWPAAPDGLWKGVVVLDGADISARLVGTVSVHCADDAAATAEFAFLPTAPMAPMALIGKPVRIAFAQRGAAEAAINPQTLFTGIVEQPGVDATTGAVSCLCTDLFQEVMVNVPRSWTDAAVGGRWSVLVSGEPADNLEYARARLASVPASLALDALQSPRVLPWHTPPRAVTLREADIWDATLQVDLPRRAELRTRVRVTGQYRYPALRNRGFGSRFTFPQAWFMFGPYGANGPLQWLTTSMVEQACGSLSGWRLQGRLLIDHPLPGSFPVSADPADGAYIVTPEVAPELAIGWQAHFATRWVQTRTETWAIEVVAPNLEALVGKPVVEEMGFSAEAPGPDPAWEADADIGPKFGAVAPIVEPIAAALAGDTVAHYPDLAEATPGYSRADYDHALRTALDQAWVRLDAAARSGRARWSMPCRPDLWLDVKATVEGSRVRAAGKIVEITHTLNAETGEATSAFAIAFGLPGDVAASLPTWTLPDVPDPDAEAAAEVDITKLSPRHDYFIGGLASSPEWDEDTMIGFATNTNMAMDDATKAARHWYPYQLTIATPVIEAEARDPLEIPVAATLEADVPTDLLEIIP